MKLAMNEACNRWVSSRTTFLRSSLLSRPVLRKGNERAGCSGLIGHVMVDERTSLCCWVVTVHARKEGMLMVVRRNTCARYCLHRRYEVRLLSRCIASQHSKNLWCCVFFGVRGCFAPRRPLHPPNRFSRDQKTIAKVCCLQFDDTLQPNPERGFL